MLMHSTFTTEMRCLYMHHGEIEYLPMFACVH